MFLILSWTFQSELDHGIILILETCFAKLLIKDKQRRAENQEVELEIEKCRKRVEEQEAVIKKLNTLAQSLTCRQPDSQAVASAPGLRVDAAPKSRLIQRVQMSEPITPSLVPYDECQSPTLPGGPQAFPAPSHLHSQPVSATTISGPVAWRTPASTLPQTGTNFNFDASLTRNSLNSTMNSHFWYHCRNILLNRMPIVQHLLNQCLFEIHVNVLAV